MFNAQALIEKIRALSPERIAEIEDFVDFIAAREQARSLTRAVAAASAPPLPPSGTTRTTTPRRAMSPGYYAFGDVVLVPFPFTSQSASKKRPAVIVSSGIYNVSRLTLRSPGPM